MKDRGVRELRAVERFTISLPVLLSWRAAGRSVRGFTRDISTRGMFVEADTEPSQGELLEFEIDLAFDEFTPLMLVEGEGRVVRVERPFLSAQPSGFAMRNVWFKLREPEQGQALTPTAQPRPARVARPAAKDRERDLRRRLALVPPKDKTGSD